jgi:hypothetical protein
VALQLDAAEPGRNLKTNMENQLTGRGFVELRDGDAVSLHGDPRRHGDTPGLYDPIGKRAGSDVQDVTRPTFGMTSVWPFERGVMSMIAMVVSLPHTCGPVSRLEQSSRRGCRYRRPELSIGD